MVDERLQLTVDLKRSGDTLLIEYYDSRNEPLGDATVSVPWNSIGVELSGSGGQKRWWGLDAITAALDRGEVGDLRAYFTQSNLVEVGHALFYTLLGNSDRWEPIIRKLFGDRGEPRPNPPRKSVRVRILTNVDALVDLPWRLAAWKGKFLADSGWTFEVVATAELGPDIDFETPCPVLVIAPSFPGMVNLDTSVHIEALRQALPEQYFTSVYFRVARTRAEIHDAFLGMRPRVLYYYGHADNRGGQICLLLGDDRTGEDPLTGNDLKLLMGGFYPQLAYINACRSGALGWYSVGYQLSPEVPVVIANATTAWSQFAGQAALEWLSSCLEHGRDPIIAAHMTSALINTRGFEWAMRTIHANYRSWRAEPLASLGPLLPIGLRLDREPCRERALSRVAEVVRRDERRVMALIAYAPPGNRLDLSHLQIKDHLEDNASHLAQISWRRVSFPVDRQQNLKARIHQELLLALGAGPSEPMEFALRRCARGLAVGGPMPVVWLNWGVFGEQQGQAITGSELREWVEFCHELAQDCPADIRVIAYLGIETTRQAQLEALLGKWALQYVIDGAFFLELLPPLHNLTLLDIAAFLQDRNNTRCPPSLVQEISLYLYQTTQGRYDKTVALVEQGEREGWYALLRQLRPEPSLGNTGTDVLL